MSEDSAPVGRPLGVFWLGLLLATLGPVFVAASTAHPVAFSMTRLWIGVVLFGLIAFGSRVRALGLRSALVHGFGSPTILAPLASCLVGGFLFGAHQVVFFHALRKASVADVMIMNALAPLIVATLAAVVYSERQTRRFWAYLAVAIVGASVIANNARNVAGGSTAGLVLAFVAMLVFTAFYLASRSARAILSTRTYLGGVFVVAALLVSTYGLLTGVSLELLDARNLLLAFLVAAVSGGLGVALMTWPLKWLQVSLPPVVRLAQPVLAAAYAWLILGQAVRGPQAIGGAITIIGVAGVVTGGRFNRALTLPPT